MSATLADLPGLLHNRRSGVWLLSGLWLAGVSADIVAFVGYLRDGLLWLGRFGRAPQLVGAGLALITVFTCAAGIALLIKSRKRQGAGGSNGPSPRKAPRALVVAGILASAGVAVVLAVGLLQWDVRHSQAQASGGFQVLIADFGVGMPVESGPRGTELSTLLARSLRREVDGWPGLEQQIGIVSVPLIDSQEAALELGRARGAQLVIWGWIPATEERSFVPSLTFIPPPGASAQDAVPAWYEMEISGMGTVEMSGFYARRLSSLINYLLGLVNVHQGAFDAAENQMRRAIAAADQELAGQALPQGEAKPAHRSLAVYHVALGRVLAAQGKSGPARQEYETALAIDPTFGPTFIGLGNIAYSENRCADALDAYERAAELTPLRAYAWYSNGNAYFCLGQYEEAERAYRKAVMNAAADDPRLPLMHLTLGTTLCHLHQTDQGMQELRAAQAAAENTPDLLRGIEHELEQCATGSASPTPAPAGTRSPEDLRTPGPPARETGTPWPTAPATSAPLPLQRGIELTVTPSPFPTALAVATPDTHGRPAHPPVPPLPATATPRPITQPVPAPRLLQPDDGAVLDPPATLAWSGPRLAAGQRFLLALQHASGVNWLVTTANRWSVPAWLQEVQPAHGFQWWVAVCEGAEPGEYSQQPCRIISPKSPSRTFGLSRPAATLPPGPPPPTLWPTVWPTAPATPTP